MGEQHRYAEIYTMTLGLATLIFGGANILVWAGVCDSMEIGIITIGGDDFFRWVWGSLVIVFGGIMMVNGSRNIRHVHQFARVLLGALMVWVIAATDMFAIVCENIPAGEEAPEFFNSLTGFIGDCAPPYPPALLLLPFTLVFVYFLYAWRMVSDR